LVWLLLVLVLLQPQIRFLLTWFRKSDKILRQRNRKKDMEHLTGCA
jgi:hypothetical protein